MGAGVYLEHHGNEGLHLQDLRALLHDHVVVLEPQLHQAASNQSRVCARHRDDSSLGAFVKKNENKKYVLSAVWAKKFDDDRLEVFVVMKCQPFAVIKKKEITIYAVLRDMSRLPLPF